MRWARVLVAAAALAAVAMYARAQEEELGDEEAYEDEAADYEAGDMGGEEGAGAGADSQRMNELNRRFQMEFTQHLMAEMTEECQSELMHLMELSRDGKPMPDPMFSEGCQNEVDEQSRVFQPIFTQKLRDEGLLPAEGGEGAATRDGQGAPSGGAAGEAAEGGDDGGSVLPTVAIVLLVVCGSLGGLYAWALARYKALPPSPPKKDKKDKKRK